MRDFFRRDMVIGQKSTSFFFLGSDIWKHMVGALSTSVHLVALSSVLGIHLAGSGGHSLAGSVVVD